MTTMASKATLWIARLFLRAAAFFFLKALARSLPDVADRMLIATSLRRMAILAGVAYGTGHASIGIMSDDQIRAVTFEEVSLWL